MPEFEITPIPPSLRKQRQPKRSIKTAIDAEKDKQFAGQKPKV